MAIEFRCTQCNKLLRASDEAAGKQAKCPECGAVMPVPGPQAQWPGEDAPADPGPARPGPESGRPFAAGPSDWGAQGGPQNPYEAPRQYGPSGYPTVNTGYRYHRRVPNYLAQAILCTLFCCLPFGIVAIVFAAQVDGKVAAGDYAGAASCSASAQTWCWVSFWLGLIPIVLWLLLVCASGM